MLGYFLNNERLTAKKYLTKKVTGCTCRKNDLR